MPTYYVRSTDGDNASDGLSWANAEADLHTPTWAAGDTIYVSDNHAQSTAAAITIATAGTILSPTKVICGDDSAEPPTAVASTGTVTTTGANSITITGSAYLYGLTFSAVSGSNNGSLLVCGSTTGATNGEIQVFENCDFIHGSTATTTQNISIGSAAATTQRTVIWKNCDVKFSGTGNRIVVSGKFEWNGGTILAGTASPTAGGTGIFTGGTTSAGSDAQALISGVDFSNFSSTTNLVQSASYEGFFIFRNCKLPASWSGALATPVAPGFRVEMHNCDSTDTNYRLWVEDYAGSIKTETTIVKSSGASDGTTSISWKMVSSANAEYPVIHLVSPEIVKWNDTTGSSKTVTVEIVHDSQGAGTGSDFQNDEIWLEVQYLGTSGVPLGSFIKSEKADVLATAADHANSSVTWTTTGLSTPVKQALSVSFTPQEKGYIHAKVVLAKASKTVYVDPVLTVA